MAVLSHAQLEALWIAEGGNPLHADTAAAIAQAESGGDTTRINNTAYPSRPGYHTPSPGSQKEYSVGLWQINMLAHPSYTEAQLLTRTGNAGAALAISSNGSNFTPWTTFALGAYLPFLSGAPGGQTGGGGTATVAASVIAPRSTNGWNWLMHAVAGDMPTAHRRAVKLRAAAMRKLA